MTFDLMVSFKCRFAEPPADATCSAVSVISLAECSNAPAFSSKSASLLAWPKMEKIQIKLDEGESLQ